MAINIPYQPTMMDYVAQLGGMYLERQNMLEQTKRQQEMLAHEKQMAIDNNASRESIAAIDRELRVKEIEANQLINQDRIKADKDIAYRGYDTQDRGIDSNYNATKYGYDTQIKLQEQAGILQKDLTILQQAHEKAIQENNLEHAEKLQAQINKLQKTKMNLDYKLGNRQLDLAETGQSQNYNLGNRQLDLAENQQDFEQDFTTTQYADMLEREKPNAYLDIQDNIRDTQGVTDRTLSPFSMKDAAKGGRWYVPNWRIFKGESKRVRDEKMLEQYMDMNNITAMSQFLQQP